MKKILFTFFSCSWIRNKPVVPMKIWAWRKVVLMKYVPLWEMLNRVLL